MTGKAALVPSAVAVLLVVATSLWPTAHSGTTVRKAFPAASAAASGVSKPSAAEILEAQRRQRLRVASCQRHPQTCAQGSASSVTSKPPIDGGRPVPRSE
jgi:hypothetical protein